MQASEQHIPEYKYHPMCEDLLDMITQNRYEDD